jgi:HAD superfamily hydrolase (TIGR01662 family)
MSSRILLFDWGNTIMVDFDLPGPLFSWDTVAWVPGAEEALKQLKTYPCYIATNAGNSNSEDVRKGLARVGADRYFPLIFCSRDIGFGKPDPRFFSFITDVLRTTADNCIMIGDNYSKDIEGAKRAGMKTIFFNPKEKPGPFPAADAMILTMDRLPDQVMKL